VLDPLGSAVTDALDRRRHIVLAPFAVIAGVLVYLGARFEPMPAASAVLLATAASGALWARRRRAVTAMR